MSALPERPPSAPPAPMTVGQYAEQQLGQRSHQYLQVVPDAAAADVVTAQEPDLVETTVELDPVVTEPAVEADGHDSFSADRKKVALLPALLTVVAPRSGLYSQRQPSVSEIVRRARTGSQVPDAGFLRTAAKSYGYGAAGIKVGLRTVEWIVDHPARLGTVLVLIALALLFPPTRQIAVWLLAPFAWAHQTLAD